MRFHRTGIQERGLNELCRYVVAMRVADIGANMGESTEIFARWYPKVFAIDTWSHEHLQVVRDVAKFKATDLEVEREFDRRHIQYKNRICKVKQASPGVAGRFPDGFFNLVYIDASHDYKSVVTDIDTWLPKTNGFIGGHDYCDTGDVARAVIDKLGGPHWLFEDSSWLVRVDWL